MLSIIMLMQRAKILTWEENVGQITGENEKTRERSYWPVWGSAGCKSLNIINICGRFHSPLLPAHEGESRLLSLSKESGEAIKRVFALDKAEEISQMSSRFGCSK